MKKNNLRIHAEYLCSLREDNIKFLCQSKTWFLDGTFSTSPNIFVQIFAILGIRARAGRPDETAPIPLVYALLPSKSTDAYAKVLRVVRDVVSQFQIAQCVPSRIMSTFELSIINACKTVHPTVPISCCFFHLGQTGTGECKKKVYKQGTMIQVTALSKNTAT